LENPSLWFPIKRLSRGLKFQFVDVGQDLIGGRYSGRPAAAEVEQERAISHCALTKNAGLGAGGYQKGLDAGQKMFTHRSRHREHQNDDRLLRQRKEIVNIQSN
jgi:hypothetical protein